MKTADAVLFFSVLLFFKLDLLGLICLMINGIVPADLTGWVVYSFVAIPSSPPPLFRLPFLHPISTGRREVTDSLPLTKVMAELEFGDGKWSSPRIPLAQAQGR